MKGWSEWLKTIHKLRRKDDMTCCETAEKLREIADHYEWYGKERLNEMVDGALKEG